MKKIFLYVALVIMSFSAHALQERHLIVIRHAQAQPSETTQDAGPLTPQGQFQTKNIAALLLKYGFDNRSIEAVFVPPVQAAFETASQVADIGVFDHKKIRTLEDLIDIPNELPAATHARIARAFEAITNSHTKGHVLVIAQAQTSQALIEVLTHEKVKLEIAGAYVVPIDPKTFVT